MVPMGQRERCRCREGTGKTTTGTLWCTYQNVTVVFDNINQGIDSFCLVSVVVRDKYHFLKWSFFILIQKMMAAQVAVMKLVMKKKIPTPMPCCMHSINP